MEKRLTKQEASEIFEQVKLVDQSIYVTCKPIIEAYGWSSKTGKKAKAFVLTFPRLKNFWKIYFGLEEYLERALSGDDHLNNVPISTKGGLKHSLSIDTHIMIAGILKNGRNELVSIGITVSRKIGKTKPLTRSVFGVVSKIDALRSDLSARCFEEHGEFNTEPYYGFHKASEDK